MRTATAVLGHAALVAAVAACGRTTLASSAQIAAGEGTGGFAAFCGDGAVDPDEGCDDANGSNADGCLATCDEAACGDGFVWAGVEACDDGNLADGDGCSSSCEVVGPACGDGSLQPGEACDLGGDNADTPALELVQGTLTRALAPLDRALDAVTFYGYASKSSHTGLEELGASRLFFYRDEGTGILSLVMHHGIDLESSGLSQPASRVLFDIVSLPEAVTVAWADDFDGELFKASATVIVGDWAFTSNSDGGVISGFPFPGTWSATLTPTFLAGITSFAFVGGDLSQTSLALGTDVVLRAFDAPSACRLDCTVPACGDARLDGGEVCDDGNATGGDGCAADCKSLD